MFECVCKDSSDKGRNSLLGEVVKAQVAKRRLRPLPLRQR